MIEDINLRFTKLIVFSFNNALFSDSTKLIEKMTVFSIVNVILKSDALDKLTPYIS